MCPNYVLIWWGSVWGVQKECHKKEFSADGIGNNNVQGVAKNWKANFVTVINRFCSTEKRRNKHTLQRQQCTFLPLVPIIACLFSRRPSAHFRLQRVIRIQTWSVWLNTRSSLSEEHSSEPRMRYSRNHNIHASAVCLCHEVRQETVAVLFFCLWRELGQKMVRVCYSAPWDDLGNGNSLLVCVMRKPCDSLSWWYRKL